MHIPTYEDQLRLVQQGLATVNVNNELSTFKYHRKVMFKNLWDMDPSLMECRGHVYNNQTGRLVNFPMHKTFNYGERGTFLDVPLDAKVVLYRKLNGFMAAASFWDGDLVVSTTGTTTSKFAEWAYHEVRKLHESEDNPGFNYNRTNLYEIVIPEDPHVVNCKEGFGAHFLGSRDHLTGFFNPTLSLNVGVFTLDEVVNQMAKRDIDSGEGWMMYLVDDPTRVCKVKTDHYIGKKRIMRMSDSEIVSSWNQDKFNRIPEIWAGALQPIKQNFLMEEWVSMDPQQRRKYLDGIYGGS